MATRVYRSVKLVVQNDTKHPHSIQGTATLKGTWSPRFEPRQGQTLASNASAEWQSESTILGTGTTAYVRLGSARGHTNVSWSLPWTGSFATEVTTSPELEAETSILDDEPDAIVIKVSVREKDAAKEVKAR